MRHGKEVLASLLALAVFGLACATNPVTGKKEISLISESQEIAAGKQSLAATEAEYGYYDDAAWNTKVNTMGQKLASVSHRPDLAWQFHVIDDASVNAFAAPGGYIYITRGILAHLNNEAQLAGVLGHEIGHVTARHYASAASQQTLANLGLGVASILSPSVAKFGDVASTGLGLFFLKYSRDHENQADQLGVDYSVKAGWDARQMAGTYETLARISATSGSTLPTYLSTHPDPAAREAIVSSLAAKAVGFRVKVLAIGPVVLSKESGKHRVRLSWMGLLLMGGYMGAIPPSPRGFRRKQMTVVGAGPLTSLSVGAILLGILAWRHRPRPTPTAYIWCASIIVVFYALSLGPVLRVWDTPTVVPMPYALLTRILPFFKMAGVTVRFMVLPMLALAVLASCGWTWLARDLTRGRIAGLAALLAFTLFETFPRPMLLTSPEVPPWVQALRRMPDSGGIVDLVTYPSDCLYHQTVHEKPFAFGYISREPASVAMEKLLKELAIRQKDYVQLHERWKYDYLIAPASPPIAGLEVLYEDATVRIYSLRPRQMP